MPLLRQPKLIPTPVTRRTPTPLMLLHIAAPQVRALSPQRRGAATDTRATSRACVRTASLSEYESETPAAAHAGAGDGRGAEVGFVGHLGRTEGGCC